MKNVSSKLCVLPIMLTKCSGTEEGRKSFEAHSLPITVADNKIG